LSFPAPGLEHDDANRYNLIKPQFIPVQLLYCLIQSTWLAQISKTTFALHTPAPTIRAINVYFNKLMFWSITMSTLRLLSATALLTLAASANASSFIVTTDALVNALKATSDLTSDATGSFRDNKIVRAARDDAASFVASEGTIRGVKLESAFEAIRQQAPQLQATDAQLAQAILTI
jgi:uncharacterized protein (TIGR02448 family)